MNSAQVEKSIVYLKNLAARLAAHSDSFDSDDCSLVQAELKRQENLLAKLKVDEQKSVCTNLIRIVQLREKVLEDWNNETHCFETCPELLTHFAEKQANLVQLLEKARSS